MTLEAYFTSNACESAHPTLVNPPAQRMYPFPLDRCIRPMSLPARRIHSLVFVRGDARRSFQPPMAWSVFFLTALPVSNEEQRASESRIRRRSISYPISLSRFLRCCSHNECLTVQLHRLPRFTLLFPTPFHLLISYPLTTLPALPSIPSKMPYSTMPRSDGGLVVDHAEDAIETEDASSNEARSKTSEERPHRPRCGLDANIFFDPQSLTPTSSSIRNLVLSSDRPASTAQHAGYGEYAPASA